MNVFEFLQNNFFATMFNIIAGIVNTVFTPVINTIVSLVPDSASRFNDILVFFEQAFTFVGFVYRQFLFLPSMFQVLFVYWFTRFSIFIVANSIRFVLRIYNMLKP